MLIELPVFLFVALNSASLCYPVPHLGDFWTKLLEGMKEVKDNEKSEQVEDIRRCLTDHKPRVTGKQQKVGDSNCHDSTSSVFISLHSHQPYGSHDVLPCVVCLH